MRIISKNANNMRLEVYKVTNKENGKIYIGITSQGVTTRWFKHCSDGLYGNSNFPIHNAIRKYGKDNFQVEVIEVIENDKGYNFLKEREKYWIKEFDSYNREVGYNLTLGGDGTFGRFHSDETKEKMRQKALGRIVSEETKLRMSLNSGSIKKVSMFTLDDELIKTFRSATDAAKEIKCDRSNVTACVKGKQKTCKGFKFRYTDEPLTDPLPEIKIEPKEKLPKPPMSEDVKKRISETNKLRWAENPERHKTASLNNHKNKVILQYDLDNNFIKEFRNVSEAVKEVGATTHTNIAKCARGIRKKSCGFIWKYKDNK